MSKRSERQKQFKGCGSFGIVSFTQDLINSAFILLQLAFNERKSLDSDTSGGHYSVHAPASIVLISTAFDQWLNESALILDVRYKGLREIAARHDTITKYKKFAKHISGKDFVISQNLRMAWEVRNEIVHWLPRKAADGTNWPEWLTTLQERGLVLSTPLPDGGDATDLATKFHSYSLALWVWRVFASAADEFLAQFPSEDEVERGMIEWSVKGFRSYERLSE